MNKFQNSMLLIPSKHRSIQSSPGENNKPLNHCFFGVPQSTRYGLTTLSHIPEETIGMSFYLGGEPEGLISSFSSSGYPQKIEQLAIGNSTHEIGSHQDYRGLINLLKNTEFPNLKQLELGVWELFHNAHCLYGNLGDVSSILRHSPKVEDIGLYGYFEITEKNNFSFLKNIMVTLEDYATASNGGFINQSSLSNLLESEFPLLEEMYIDLTCQEDQYGYKFPQKFLDGMNVPMLKKLEIAGGFLSDEKERLLGSPIYNRSGVVYHLNDMVVS